jgi:large subunit ribosomal protein L35
MSVVAMAASLAACTSALSRVSLCSSFSKRIGTQSLSSVSSVSSSVMLGEVRGQAVVERRQPGLVVEAKEGYKLKTHKASAKRFKVTGTGKVMRRSAWRQHLLRKKSVRRKNRLAGAQPVFRGDIDKIVGALPYLKVNRRRMNAIERFEDVEEDDEIESGDE